MRICEPNQSRGHYACTRAAIYVRVICMSGLDETDRVKLVPYEERTDMYMEASHLGVARTRELYISTEYVLGTVLVQHSTASKLA
jgi:hypothetical protein